MPSIAEIKAAIARHGSQAAASVQLGMSKDQVYRALKSDQDQGSEARRHRDENIKLKSRIKHLERSLIEARDESDMFRDIKKASIKPASWKPQISSSKTTRLTPILFTSDFQVGEVVNGSEIDGINSYDPDIFVQRYQSLIRTTIDLAENHVGKAEFPGIIYLRGGDSISGGIHEELAETDKLASIPALRLLMQQEREGIRQLREKFGRVHVISVPGNHGRNTHKSHSKGYSDHSYETLLTWWLQTLFEGDPNVTFQTPDSGDAYFVVDGWRFLLAHGDRIGSRGGQGFVGPAATIARGHQKLRQNWSASGFPTDYILTGHFHTSLRLESGFANGSLVGYGEYARDLRCLPDSAKQWLLFVHEAKGVSTAFDIQCSSLPRRRASTAGVFD